jgi:3-oxoacyl-[acyl-carrier-protein] synthase II
MRRVVVTGLGMVSPVGLDLPTSWKETLAGRSGVRRITAFNADPFPVQIAAELKGFEPAKYFETKEVTRITKFCQYAVAASEEAVLDAKLHYKDSDTRRWGTVIGVGLGGLEDIELRSLELNKDGYRKVSPFFLPYTIPNMAAGLVSTRFNLKGPNMCTTTALQT